MMCTILTSHMQRNLKVCIFLRLHAWGDDLIEAFEQVGIAMYGYMTELENVEVLRSETISAQGDDILSLLFHFLDELLFLFCAEPFFIGKQIEIIEFDKEAFRIEAVVRGETFDLDKHPQGTEVKAITYSNMQVFDEEGNHQVYVIIDI
ncbi:protein archease-like isoform X2 [Xenia sp. Carnegie-2017]|uniref:protein archease-like isoform X2 n=1 Tax=Xenia sp. Carnegie-2017 TaxID=2897299 RepID=UPI001F04E7DC|nr:protein archease-like isoform X2 [Xenia sp. Carnegie-2017]